MTRQETRTDNMPPHKEDIDSPSLKVSYCESKEFTRKNSLDVSIPVILSWQEICVFVRATRVVEPPPKYQTEMNNDPKAFIHIGECNNHNAGDKEDEVEEILIGSGRNEPAANPPGVKGDAENRSGKGRERRTGSVDRASKYLALTRDLQKVPKIKLGSEEKRNVSHEQGGSSMSAAKESDVYGKMFSENRLRSSGGKSVSDVVVARGRKLSSGLHLSNSNQERKPDTKLAETQTTTTSTSQTYRSSSLCKRGHCSVVVVVPQNRNENHPSDPRQPEAEKPDSGGHGQTAVPPDRNPREELQSQEVVNPTCAAAAGEACTIPNAENNTPSCLAEEGSGSVDCTNRNPRNHPPEADMPPQHCSSSAPQAAGSGPGPVAAVVSGYSAAFQASLLAPPVDPRRPQDQSLEGSCCDAGVTGLSAAFSAAGGQETSGFNPLDRPVLMEPRQPSPVYWKSLLRGVTGIVHPGQGFFLFFF